MYIYYICVYIYIYMYIYIYIYIYVITYVITSRKFQLKQTWRLTKKMTEMKLDTEETMKL